MYFDHTLHNFFLRAPSQAKSVYENPRAVLQVYPIRLYLEGLRTACKSTPRRIFMYSKTQQVCNEDWVEGVEDPLLTSHQELNYFFFFGGDSIITKLGLTNIVFDFKRSPQSIFVLFVFLEILSSMSKAQAGRRWKCQHTGSVSKETLAVL